MDVEAVWFAYFTFIGTFAVFFFPVTVIVWPFLLWILFKFYYLMLWGFSKNPDEPAHDESMLVIITLISWLTYLTYASVIIIVTVGGYATNFWFEDVGGVKTKKACGPIISPNTIQSEITRFLSTSSNWFFIAVNFLFNNVYIAIAVTYLLFWFV